VAGGSPPEDPQLKQRKLAWIRETHAHLMGRKTYEEMSVFWPTTEDEYAKPMNAIPKVVFSRSLEVATWPETRIARGDLVEEVDRLKRESEGTLTAYGGAALAEPLIRLGPVGATFIMGTTPMPSGAARSAEPATRTGSDRISAAPTRWRGVP
jgi:dihydrofolate reductase